MTNDTSPIVGACTVCGRIPSVMGICHHFVRTSQTAGYDDTCPTCFLWASLEEAENTFKRMEKNS